MPKRSIRSHFLAERKACPIETCTAASAAIQTRFMQSRPFRDSQCLALYSAIHNEVLTAEIFARALRDNKTLVLPRVRGEELEFVVVESPAEMTVGSFGVLEPRGRALIPVDKLDLVVVPGVAFDKQGHRLGYGRGYYDRALAGCRSRCVKVGFAYDFQLVDELPAAEHDEKLSLLITESRTFNFFA